MLLEHFPITISEDEVLSERDLLKNHEAGLFMNDVKSVRWIIVHCSASREDRDYTVEQMLRDHKARGFRTIGYHFYIRRNGVVTQHRHLLGRCSLSSVQPLLHRHLLRGRIIRRRQAEGHAHQGTA